jgi:hypothetical protein
MERENQPEAPARAALAGVSGWLLENHISDGFGFPFFRFAIHSDFELRIADFRFDVFDDRRRYIHAGRLLNAFQSR